MSYLHTLVKYFKVSEDVSELEAEFFKFDKNGDLTLNGETFKPERETLIKRGNPYAVNWEIAWFEIDAKEDDEIAPTCVEEDHATRMERLEKDYEVRTVFTLNNNFCS